MHGNSKSSQHLQLVLLCQQENWKHVQLLWDTWDVSCSLTKPLHAPFSLLHFILTYSAAIGFGSCFAVRMFGGKKKPNPSQNSAVQYETLRRNGRRSYFEGFSIFLIARRLLPLSAALSELPAAASFALRAIHRAALYQGRNKPGWSSLSLLRLLREMQE